MNDYLLDFSDIDSDLFNFKGLDLDSGKRDVDLKEENKKINQKIPQLVSDLAKFEGLPQETVLKQLGGGKNLIPVKPERKEQSILGKVLNYLYGTPEAAETELVDGKLVAKNRPKGLGRFTTGLADALTANITDFDRQGGGFLGLSDENAISGLGIKPTDFKLSKTIKDQLKTQIEEGSENPVESAKEAAEAIIDFNTKMAGINRKNKLIDTALESAVMRANMPFVTDTLKDITTFKQQQLLDAERIKQREPNAVQARLLAGDTGFAQQADAIAKQYLAAVEGAKAGAFPRNVSFSA